MSQPNADQTLVDHLLASLAGRVDHDRPFPFHVVADALPAPLRRELCELPCQSRPMTGARADNNQSRVYFTPAFRARHAAADTVAHAFQNGRLAATLAGICGALLRDSYLLVELACDSGVSELRPHRDIGVKRFTALFYLSADPSLRDSGTDLYTPKTSGAAAIATALARGEDPSRDCFEAATVRPPHGAGFGYFFTPSETSWHGFDRRELPAVRKTLIVNYVGPTASGERYRSVQNLAFPDKPVET